MALKKKGESATGKKSAPKKQVGKATTRSTSAAAPARGKSAAPARGKAPIRAKAPAKTPTARASTWAGKESGKTRVKCQVTFRLPKIAAPEAKSVCIVGDFNNWNTRADPMEKQQNGNYSISMDLEPGREYQYRYLIDASRWENDWNADKYVRSPLGSCDNSVKIT